MNKSTWLNLAFIFRKLNLYKHFDCDGEAKFAACYKSSSLCNKKCLQTTEQIKTNLDILVAANLQI